MGEEARGIIGGPVPWGNDEPTSLRANFGDLRRNPFKEATRASWVAAIL